MTHPPATPTSTPPPQKAPPPKPKVGIFGRFRVERVAGKGGMAVVYKAFAEGVGDFSRPVALKQLLTRMTRDPGGLPLFVEEARVSARLDHPNIVQVYEFCRDRRGRPFLVLEWVEGLDMGHWLHCQEGAADWGLVGAMGVEVLDALDFAHRHADDAGEPSPIIHRDVSPGNIMLGLHGHAKLADFGLARASDRGRMTAEGVLKGKVSFTAPELLTGSAPSPQTDVFSLSVTLWEGLAGRRLFQGTRIEVLGQIANGPIPHIHTVRPDIPASVADVLMLGLTRSPAERWSTARAMRRALVAALAQEGRCPDPVELGRSVAKARHQLGLNNAADAISDGIESAVDLSASMEADLDRLSPYPDRASMPPALPSEPFELIPFSDPSTIESLD